jgi:hypothetical protein
VARRRRERVDARRAASVSTALGGRAFPSVASLLSLATYARVFHTLARDRGSVDALVAEIDAGAGVASTALCNGVKAAFVARAEYGNALVSVFAALNDPQCGGAVDASADDAHRGAAAARDRRAQRSACASTRRRARRARPRPMARRRRLRRRSSCSPRCTRS